MFDLEICEPRRIALIRFRGELSEADFAALDVLGRGQQASEPFDCIFDMTHVEQADLATEFIAKRGDMAPVFPNSERIYVVPQDDLKLLTRLFAGYQAARGWRAPLVVETLDEAFAKLGVAAEYFYPVIIGGPRQPN